MRGEDARQRDEKDAGRKGPQEWLDLAELGRKYYRTLARQQEDLRRGAAMLSDDCTDFRDRINRVILPGIQNDVEELRRMIRKAELFAEHSGRRTAKSRQNR